MRAGRAWTDADSDDHNPGGVGNDDSDADDDDKDDGDDLDQDPDDELEKTFQVSSLMLGQDTDGHIVRMSPAWERHRASVSWRSGACCNVLVT